MGGTAQIAPNGAARYAHQPQGAARIIGEGAPTARPQAAPANAPRPVPQAAPQAAQMRPQTRPAPKPAEPARRPQVTYHDDEFSQAQRHPADDSLSFAGRAVAGAGRPSNGTNGPKTIE
jgi:hypothetical protein